MRSKLAGDPGGLTLTERRNARARGWLDHVDGGRSPRASMPPQSAHGATTAPVTRRLSAMVRGLLSRPWWDRTSDLQSASVAGFLSRVRHLRAVRAGQLWSELLSSGHGWGPRFFKPDPAHAIRHQQTSARERGSSEEGPETSSSNLLVADCRPSLTRTRTATSTCIPSGVDEEATQLTPGEGDRAGWAAARSTSRPSTRPASRLRAIPFAATHASG